MSSSSDSMASKRRGSGTEGMPPAALYECLQVDNLGRTPLHLAAANGMLQAESGELTR